MLLQHLIWKFFNPIRPDPFEFLIGLSVCLWDTNSLTTIFWHILITQSPLFNGQLQPYDIYETLIRKQFINHRQNQLIDIIFVLTNIFCCERWIFSWKRSILMTHFLFRAVQCRFQIQIHQSLKFIWIFFASCQKLRKSVVVSPNKRVLYFLT